MKAIAKRMGQEDAFEELIIRNQSILPPKGASEIEIKTQQVCRALLNLALKFCFMVLTDIPEWCVIIFLRSEV